MATGPCADYDKRKYMWKLLYTRMLGYDVDFGHKQAMDLIAAPG
jgi:AP-2 complex subunit alpha